MIKVVLQGILVFWMHLFHIPRAIIHNIDTLISKFLWSSISPNSKIHLIYLNVIYRPITLGGWGMLHTRWFYLALLDTNL